MPEGERSFDVRFADETRKEFKKLGHTAAVAILAAIDKKLTTDPKGYGAPLFRDLSGYFKLAVGQWRVVYHVENERVLVLVLAVGKRAEGDQENIWNQLSRHDLDTRREGLELKTTDEREGDKPTGARSTRRRRKKP